MLSSNFGPPAERRDPFAKRSSVRGKRPGRRHCAARGYAVFSVYRAGLLHWTKGRGHPAFVVVLMYFTQTKALKCCCERRRRQPPTRAPYLRLRRNRRRVLLSTPRTKKSGPVCLSSPNRATEGPESCKLLALKIEL
eukprot:scaffold30518_cov67-Phaeocystis_antarctica.AAC.7